jgi:hypothetical protein
MFTLKEIKQAARATGFVIIKTNAKVNGKQAYRVSDLHGLFTKSGLISVFLEN